MARRFSPADAAACAAAGVGAWFSRASLDVFAGPGGSTRVAMLPAPVELVGLAAVACVAACLLRRILVAQGRGSTASRSDLTTPHLLLPMVSVVALAVPYLPWLADAVPAWQALAGPARFALWALVVGQVAWLGIDATLERREATDVDRQTVLHGSRPFAPHAWPALVVFLASLAAGAALARAVSPDAFGPAGVAGAGRTAIALRILLTAATSTLIWLAAARAAGTGRAATAAWLGVAGAAPVLLGGLFWPGVSAAVAACVALAALWPGGADDRRAWAGAVRGGALALLAWLDVSSLPLALALGACLLWRMRPARAAVVAAGAPLLLAGLAGIRFVLHGLPPIVGHESLWWSAAAVLVDQQDGVLLYAPAMALAVPGLWLLWREDGASRMAAVETVAGTGAVLLSAGWQSEAARGLAIPGAALMPALLLLVVPLARWVRHGASETSRVALARLLVLWGLIATAALPVARGDFALVRARDGASGLLEWLAPSRDLVRVAPMAPPAAFDAFAFVGSALIWLAVAATLWWIVRRSRPASPAVAAVTVTIGALAALTLGSAAVEAALGPRLPARVAPALRVRARMLDRFDARRRPVAVAYDRWRWLPAAAVPELFAFDATAGARQHPQPLRVLLNMRLALPAGDYLLTLDPRPGATLNGNAGLQVGRMGPPMRAWQIAPAPATSWSAAFTLPVDASFVGLRTTPEFESQVGTLRIQPARVVNRSDRRDLPTVLSAATYGHVMVTFHGDQVYAERDGFWVRGRSTLLATFAPPDTADREPGVRLSLHGGDAPTDVRVETSTWGTTLALAPGVSRELLVPALQGQALLPVRITAGSGFVPAETHGGADRRLLGCWVEVLE